MMILWTHEVLLWSYLFIQSVIRCCECCNLHIHSVRIFMTSAPRDNIYQRICINVIFRDIACLWQVHVIIQEIFLNGAIHKNGRLFPGDQLVAVRRLSNSSFVYSRPIGFRPLIFVEVYSSLSCVSQLPHILCTGNFKCTVYYRSNYSLLIFHWLTYKR